MESLTHDDQDVKRFLNCLDGEARLPPVIHSLPLSHAEPPVRTRPAYSQTLGVLAAVSTNPECRIGPSRGGAWKRRSRGKAQNSRRCARDTGRKSAGRTSAADVDRATLGSTRRDRAPSPSFSYLR